MVTTTSVPASCFIANNSPEPKTILLSEMFIPVSVVMSILWLNLFVKVIPCA